MIILIERLKNMLRVAFGQSKMGSRPCCAILHLIVYVGFILINIELLEIILDGILGKLEFLLIFWVYFMIT